ncbi:uncharacterized protein LOC129575628 isoform X2 [Sitodiplosis mosellana]|uniref:uncharacterized protein LOC129575628 isoform X2 n=1 Tax=Sitodiplosis mosellana TaxID=263140 RepID=UPI002444E3C7|nr:uncharacterized protein LOC129575628 isoform X2 [Sitodiplosis mosellana]
MNGNFESIENLPTEDLQCIPKEQILKTIQAVLKDEGDTCAAFEFAFTKFSNILSLDEINELVCEHILPHLKGKYDEAITSIDSQDEEFTTNIIGTVFQLFSELSESIHKKLEDVDKFSLSNVELYLLNTLHFLCKILPHQEFASHDNIKPYCDAMCQSVTRVLVCPKLEIDVALSELKTCRKVLQALVQLGYHQSQKDDVKSMANTWKHLSKLATDFHTIYHTLQQQNCSELKYLSEDLLDWVAYCIDNICDLITANVQKMQEHKKGTKESMFVIKVTTFYLKLMENLAEVYNNENFRGQSKFISLYETTLDIARNNEDIRNYTMLINNALSNVLSNTFNCTRFSMELLSNFRDDHIHISLEVTKLLLHSNCTSNNWYLNHEDIQRNILHHLLFVCIPKEMDKIYTDHLYDDVVILCGLLILTAASQQVERSLERILVEAILTDNARQITILMDIWIIFLNYASDDTRSMYCKLWLSMSQNLSSIPRCPSSVLIQNLSKHTLSLLSECHRSEILRELPYSPALAIFGCDCDVSKLKQYGQEIVDKIKQTLAKLNPKSEIATNNECLELMSALSSFKSPSSSSYLLRSINDEQLTNYLTDALSRSKTRCVELLLTSVLRVLLWQKYMCRNSSVEIDYSDSSEVRKFYVLELIGITQMAPDRINDNTLAVLSSFQGLDDLLLTRIQKTLRNSKPNTCGQNKLMPNLSTENQEYFQEILQTDRRFGCMTLESCLNQSAIFKRSFEQIIQEAKKLKTTWENYPQFNLAHFSDEITYLSDFFNRLHTSNWHKS